MGYVVSTSAPASEMVSLAEMKNYLRVPSVFLQDDSHITGLIAAAREHMERVTGKCLAQRTLRQVLDSFPYYTDTMQSQLAYPPSYYSLPLYSSTLWNYSQMIKLFYPPVISVQAIRFVQPDGSIDSLEQDIDFILDRISQPARIFPIPGQYWPPNYYTPNSCEIDFTAGYLPDPEAAADTHSVTGANPGQQPDSIIMPGIPHTFIRILKMLVNFWYDNRSSEIDPKLEAMIQAEACYDFAPSRG